MKKKNDMKLLLITSIVSYYQMWWKIFNKT